MPPGTAPVIVQTAQGPKRRRRYSNARTIWLHEYNEELGCMNPACKHPSCTYPSRHPPPIILLTLLKGTEFELDHVANKRKSMETSRMIILGSVAR
jgi:hypothetical protein